MCLGSSWAPSKATWRASRCLGLAHGHRARGHMARCRLARLAWRWGTKQGPVCTLAWLAGRAPCQRHCVPPWLGSRAPSKAPWPPLCVLARGTGTMQGPRATSASCGHQAQAPWHLGLARGGRGTMQGQRPWLHLAWLTGGHHEQGLVPPWLGSRAPSKAPWHLGLARGRAPCKAPCHRLGSRGHQARLSVATRLA